jgi:hypothetical protein
LDVGGGCIIGVTRADYSYKQQSQQLPESSEEKQHIVVLKNAFDVSVANVSFLAELEDDLLAECSKYGPIRSVLTVGIARYLFFE